jgi:hypothetical protein
MVDSYPEDITSEAKEEIADRPQRRLQKKKWMAEPRKKSKMMKLKPRKSRFPETFTGSG